MANILIVDDEARVRTILKIMLNAEGHQAEEAGDGYAALKILENGFFDLVISDIRMDGLDGNGLLTEIKQRDLGCPVVFITAFATLESAVEALRLGAADYLVKPFEEKQVLLAVERALGVGRVMVENIRLKKILNQDGEKEPAVIVSPAMLNVRDMAIKVASSDTTVMITGESGTGKEVVARLIHQASQRARERFVAVNCAAFTPSILESELFGHEKGSFTGAAGKKEGKFEFADKGTLFLDEVGDLPFEAQAKLLRVIQEKNLQRVGGNQDIPVNTRLICATNKDLPRMVKERQFREDLYYRINVFPIQVPPLRERKKALAPLATTFIRKFAMIRELPGEVLTPGALRILTDYPWPGNVRELANVIERTMILKSGHLPVTSDDLRFLGPEYRKMDDGDPLLKLPPTGISFEKVQQDIVNQAMALTANNQSAAARLLGLTRARFRTLLKQEDNTDCE